MFSACVDNTQLIMERKQNLNLNEQKGNSNNHSYQTYTFL